jgi:hypothetical protein
LTLCGQRRNSLPECGVELDVDRFQTRIELPKETSYTKQVIGSSCTDSVKREWLESVRLSYVSFYGMAQDVVGAQNWLSPMTFTKAYAIEKTRFLKGLFR